MITKEQTISLTYRDTIYHVRAKNAYGSPMRARVNGAIKLWKTRPLEFRLPIARGLYEHGYLDEANAESWSLTP